MSASKISRRDFLRVSVTAAGSAVLAACAPAATPSPTAAPTTAATLAPTAAAEPVVVEFWNGDPVDYQQGYEVIVNAYNAEHPETKVEIKNAPGGALDEKITIMIAGDVGPDCWCQIPTPSTARLGHMADLTPFMAADGIDPASTWFDVAWKSRVWEGKHYSVPRDVGWSSFSYNQDIFDEMGVEYPTDGWTVDQYLEKALATTDADKGYWGTNHVGAGALLWMSSMPFNMGFQANSEDGRQVAGLLDSEASINAIQFILDKEEKHKVGPNAAAMDALGNGFASGKIAIGDASTWGLKDQRELPFKWGLVRAPVVTGNQEYCWGGAVQFMMWSKAENQQNIWDFLKYASTDGSKLAHEAGQWQSPMPSVWTEVGDDQDPHLNFYMEYAKLPTQLPPYEREKFWEAVGTPFFDIWPRYLENGERPLEDIVKDATAQAQAGLDDAFAQS